ncbi:T9SS type A sorting domain-containing protein [candidate division WOR-3 bacterium]|nr:T9SS type A sorting domain-containing protein [candidate division WOR-3 bacterium]
MFFFVLISLVNTPGQWRWVDETERISMGLSFNPYVVFSDSQTEDIVFTDLDLDGDEDMLRCDINGKSYSQPLEVFENFLTTTGRQWRLNQTLIDGIAPATQASSLGSGNLNADGREELLILSSNSESVFVNIGEPGYPLWIPDSTLLGGLRVCEPDFADIDEDGDLDMLCNGPRFYWNRGTPQHPSWVADTSYLGSLNALSMANQQPTWIDWDQDGIWDLFTTGQIAYADPPPMPGAIILHRNNGTAVYPEWTHECIYEWYIPGCVSLNDWNNDGVIDFLIQGNEYEGGYQYYPGELIQDSPSYDFLRPAGIWGGILGTYPSAADINGTGTPELVLSEVEHHWGLEGAAEIVDYFFPHYRRYSLDEKGTYWKRDAHGYSWFEGSANGYIQYADFGNDGRVDYVLNFNGLNTLYRNQGSKYEPEWIRDDSAFKKLPYLFPSCFIDIYGNARHSAIGISEDGVLIGCLNTRPDDEPQYERNDNIITGLEGLMVSYMSSGDLNNDGRCDLAVNTTEGELIAFFNTGHNEPRWEKHTEVFDGIQSGNPALFDMDDDGDLDLFIVQDGRLHYYRNASDEPGAFESPTHTPEVRVILVGHEAEIRLSLDVSCKAYLAVYNVLGQRMAKQSQKPSEGEVRFRISQRPGVYFYRIVADKENLIGKIVLY